MEGLERAKVEDERAKQIREHANSSFGRDFTSSVHLYLTHWMWERNLGFMLHPAIPTHSDLTVACINDSTGVWTIDLARRHPNFQCHAFDVSAEQYPPTNWVPANVTLSVLDFTKPVPLELRGQYDVIRCNWTGLHSRNGEFMKIIDNILQFLKPGGYFQWEEADVPSCRAVASRPELPTEDMTAMCRKMVEGIQQITGSDMAWASHLDYHAQSRRLNVIANSRYPIPDDIAVPWTLQHLMAAMGMIQNLSDEPDLAADWLDTYDRAAIAVMHGVSMRMDIVVCLAQTPTGRTSVSEALRAR